jgi:hypothetical protein
MVKAILVLVLTIPMLQACGGSSSPAATTKPPAATDTKPVFETPPKQG